MKLMIILGIETTCDETGVGIVKDGTKVLASIVASSVVIHQRYGGVVPEAAAREQVRLIIPVTREACHVSGIKCQDVDAVAVAFGPGLLGSLLVGVETAKAMAIVWGKPLVAVNHLMGHVYANWLETPNPKFPLVALIVSGGHTDLILMNDHRKSKWLGGTRDDAAGEAFDKVARVLGLGYPGGPEVEKLATSYQRPETSIKLPRPMIGSDDFDFSFAGLKTAVANLVTRNQRLESSYPEIACEFQKAMIDVLVAKTLRAAKKFGVRSIVVGGGVAANSELRRQMSDVGQRYDIGVFFPPKKLSIDNGAMIATAAYWQRNFVDPLKLQADPGLYFV